MTVLAFAILAVFAVVALLHLLWALRIWWPIDDEAALARAVVGTKGISRMPGRAITFAVVAVVGLGMIWVLLLAGLIALPLPGWLVTLGGAAMAAILLARGLGSYAASRIGWQRDMPFDRLWFSPLITALGLGVALLTFA
jgi:Protein of unknown function (DUF3995)